MAKKRRTKKRTTHRRGRPSKAQTALASLSTAELERELEARDAQAAELEARREELLAEIEEIDAQLNGHGHGSTSPRRSRKKKASRRRGSQGAARKKSTRKKSTTRRRKRPQNKMNLVEALHKTLKGKTMSVSEATEAVQKAGYKTGSSNFRVIVNQALINPDNKKLFKKVARGQYTAK